MVNPTLVFFVFRKDTNKNSNDMFELIATILAMFSLVVSILVFCSNSLSSLKSLSIAEQANKIANNALEISIREHKIKIVPSFRAECLSINTSLKEPDADQVIFLVENISDYSAKVESFEILGEFNPESIFYRKPFEPIYLKRGQQMEIYLYIRPEKKLEMINHIKRDSSFLIVNREQSFRQIVFKQVLSTKIWLLYSNDIEDKYSIILKRNSKSKEYHGKPYAAFD